MRPIHRTIRKQAPPAARPRPGLFLGPALALACVLAGLALGPLPLSAQETPEGRAFSNAAQDFQNALFDKAASKFQQFVAGYPQSPMLPEAILLQARALIAQTNPATAIALLHGQMAKAGPLADQYRYRLGEAHMLAGNYIAAADSFVYITRQFTNSTLLLEASHGEALARFKLGEYARAIELIQDPKGAFQQARRQRPNDEFSLRTQLLLAEALLQQRQFRAAEEAAAQLPPDVLAEYRWDRQYLLCRILVAEQRLPAALGQTTNLIALAATNNSAGLVADSVTLQAKILESLGRLEEAIRSYTKNLAETMPSDRRRLALLRIIELRLGQDNVEDAAQLLENFLIRRPEDAATDVVLLASGELQLKLYLQSNGNEAEETASAVIATNRLQDALGRFDKLLLVHTNSSFRGRALLDKGWCLWLDKQFTESGAAFRAAAETLPFSVDQAVSRFKYADARYQQGDLTNALRLYRALTNDYASLPAAKDVLFDQAVYEIARIHIDLGEETNATAAMEEMFVAYAQSPLAERSLWLVAQDMVRRHQPAEARQIFSDFMKRFPGRALIPELELAVALTYFHELRWPVAIQKYEEWLGRHAEHELRYRAAFNLAWANARANRPTNAFNLFTNFVATFPTNELAPRAQFWVAEYFHSQSNYAEALRNFQSILENTNWSSMKSIGDLPYRARLRAGKSAVAGQMWPDAVSTTPNGHGHFNELLNDRSCPDDIYVETLFAYGDSLILQPKRDSAQPLDRFKDARDAFAIITQSPSYATNRLAPLASGRIGDCCLQLASADPKEYANATNAYWNVITNDLADIQARSLAEYGLGRACEFQATSKVLQERGQLLDVAFDHYYSVFMGRNRRDGEELDPIAIRRAGLAAGRLAEDQQKWKVAMNIYERLEQVLPSLRPHLQERINKIRSQTDQRN